jgi:hypothetical protein
VKPLRSGLGGAIETHGVELGASRDATGPAASPPPADRTGSSCAAADGGVGVANPTHAFARISAWLSCSAARSMERITSRATASALRTSAPYGAPSPV